MVDLRPSGGMFRSTALHAIAAALMSWFALVVPAVFIHAGLRHGWKGAAGAVFGAVGILSVIALFAAVPPIGVDDMTGPLAMLLELGLPALAAVALIRRRARLGTVLVAAVATGAAGLLAGELLMRLFAGYSPYAEVVESFRKMSAETIEFYRKGGFPSEGIRAMERIAAAIGNSFVPTLLIISTVLTFTFSLVLVPRFTAAGQSGSAYLFRNLALPEWMLFAFVAGGVSPLLDGAPRVIGLNILAVVISLYVIQGLAVYRAFVLRLPFGFFGSAVAYLMIAILPQISVPLMFVAGLFDPFFDFRKLNRKEKTDESHSD